MTIWSPVLQDADYTRFEAIARAIACDVDSGVLAPGTRLPTHRALASQLRVAIPTVSRAYALAEQWGLVSGEVGRGTFVRHRGLEGARLEQGSPRSHGMIDLASQHPPPLRGIESRALAQALRELAARADLSTLMRAPTIAGPSRAHDVVARWLASGGLEDAPDRVVMSVGAQQALMSVFMAICRPGDVVLCECVTYPGMRAAADALRLRLVPIAMDEDGLIPASLEAAACKHRPRALYTVPTVHTVTAALMPESRRAEVANITRAHDLMIVEDDEYSFVLPHAPAPLSAYAPERSFFIADIHKVIAPGIRVGFVLAPQNLVRQLAEAIRTCVWTIPSPMLELTVEWIARGRATAIVAHRRAEIDQRRRHLAGALRGLDWRSPPGAHQAWIDLPSRVRGERMRERGERAGVLVGTPESCRVGRAAPPNGLIIALGGEADRTRFKEGLEIVARLLRASVRSTGE